MNITTEERTKRFAELLYASGWRHFSDAQPGNLRAVVERIEEAVEAMRLAGCNAVARAEEEHKKELAQANERAFPHWCKDGHEKIGFSNGPAEEVEWCPVCVAIHERDALRKHNAKLWKWANAHLTQLRNDGIGFDDQREIEALLKSNTP